MIYWQQIETVKRREVLTFPVKRSHRRPSGSGSPPGFTAGSKFWHSGIERPRNRIPWKTRWPEPKPETIMILTLNDIEDTSGRDNHSLNHLLSNIIKLIEKGSQAHTSSGSSSEVSHSNPVIPRMPPSTLAIKVGEVH